MSIPKQYENHEEEWRTEAAQEAYEHKTRGRHLHHSHPDYSAPEGYCSVCEDYTTDINQWGECRTHGVEVTG